jgi:hypothetical protein
MSIDTAIESMIESYIDDQDFVSRTDASMEAESYTDQCIGDIQDELGVLMVRLEALEEFKALEDKAREDKALDLLDTVARAEIDSVRAKALEEQEPRAVNQIDWILGERAGSIAFSRAILLSICSRVCALELGNRGGISNHDDHHDDTGNCAQSYQRKTGGRIMRVIIELEFENLPSRVDVENYLKELIDDGSLFYHLAQREA